MLLSLYILLSCTLDLTMTLAFPMLYSYITPNIKNIIIVVDVAVLLAA